MTITNKKNKSGVVVTGKNLQRILTRAQKKLDEMKVPIYGRQIWCPTPFGVIHVIDGKLQNRNKRGFEWFNKQVNSLKHK